MSKQANLFFATALGFATLLAATPSKADITGFFEEGLKSPRIETASGLEGLPITIALDWKQNSQTGNSTSLFNVWDLSKSKNSRNDFMNVLQYTDEAFSAKSHSKFNGSSMKFTFIAPKEWKQNFLEMQNYEEVDPRSSRVTQHSFGGS